MATNDRDTNQQQSGSSKGFASMDEDKHREISSKGGKSAHEKALRISLILKKQQRQGVEVAHLTEEMNRGSNIPHRHQHVEDHLRRI